jgi:hypothetical protein
MKVIEKVDLSFWLDVAKSCSYATFYHTPYWAQLMTDTFAYIDETRGFVFDDGTKAVFPFMRIRKRFFDDNYISGPLFVHGGPISDKKLSDQQSNEIIEYMTSSYKDYNRIIIRGNPFNQGINVPGFRKIDDVDFVIEIFKYKNEQDLIGSYAKNVRYKINKAKRSNIIMKNASSLKEYEKLYELYQKCITYWRRDLTHHPLKLFQNMYNFNNKNVRCTVAYKDNEMIGGEIRFCWNESICGKFSYYNRAYSRLHACEYRRHLDSLFCMQEGIKYYNLGPSGGEKGLEYFKKTLGAKEYPYCAWIKENSALEKLRAIKRKIMPRQEIKKTFKK